LSKVTIGVEASHSTLMNTHWDKVVDKQAAQRFKDALGEANQALVSSQPDVVVVVGSNHFRGFWLDLMPTFTIAVGECSTLGDGGTPAGKLSVDSELARAICFQVVEAGFDAAFSLRLEVDHGIAHAVQYLLAGLEVPVVPVIVNVFAPPLASMERCNAFGQAIGAAIANDGAHKRVAVVGSGGLSHKLPFPKWWDPRSEADELLLEAWLEGRGRWQEYDARRRQITVAATSRINTSFDQMVLSWIEEGSFSQLAKWSTSQIEEVAGNGGQELRTWMIASAIAGHAPGRKLCYEPIDEWLTGMGVAIIDDPVPVASIGPGSSTPDFSVGKNAWQRRDS